MAITVSTQLDKSNFDHAVLTKMGTHLEESYFIPSTESLLRNYRYKQGNFQIFHVYGFEMGFISRLQIQKQLQKKKIDKNSQVSAWQKSISTQKANDKMEKTYIEIVNKNLFNQPSELKLGQQTRQIIFCQIHRNQRIIIFSIGKDAEKPSTFVHC